MMKLYETHRLHYGEYLYKIRFNIELSDLIRRLHKHKDKKLFDQEISKIEEKANSGKKVCVTHSIDRRKMVTIHKDEIDDARKIGNFIATNDVKIRTESPRIHIYSNDLAELVKLSESLSISDTIGLWKPDEKLVETLTKDSNAIVVKNADGFKYRVILRYNYRGGRNLATWITKNKNKVRASEYAIYALTTDSWFSNLIIDVKDEKAITLFRMLDHSSIQKVYNIVEKS